MHGREARDRAGVGRALLGRYRRGADGIGALVVEIGTAAGGMAPTQARLAVSHCMSRLARPASTTIAMRLKHDQFPISQLHSFYNLLARTENLT